VDGLRWWLSWVFALFLTGTAARGEAPRPVQLPPGLPRYDLRIQLDPANRIAHVNQAVLFTNKSSQPVSSIVFNAHARYTVPPGDIGLVAKTLEYLRVAPSEGLPSGSEAPLQIREATSGKPTPVKLPVHPFANDATAIEVDLPAPLAPGETVEVVLTFDFHIPNKKGRWGQWEGMTMLAQWLPTVAVHDERGWHPTPFIPWHQPFCNEAGIYTGTIVIPADQKLACPCPIAGRRETENGCVELTLEPTCLRDFSLACSARYGVVEAKVGRVTIRCLHLPEHAGTAGTLVETVSQALPIYEQWLGAYPYSEYTIAETAFGWNGNECGAMVMIDERMMHMPKLARAYPVYLIQHEFCHQWFYNMVGTDGYAETWMDEGFATYLSHRLADRVNGKNNKLLDFPLALSWLPTIHREDFRYVGMIGARKRGDVFPTVQPMEKFGHLPNLLSTTYDRGGKLVGMIEERMGEAAFLDFLRLIVAKYRFRILRVDDLKAELEAYTGRSWDEFFRHYVRGSGMCDWAVDDVKIEGRSHPVVRKLRLGTKEPVQAEIRLKLCGGVEEPTVLGIRYGDGKQWDLRIPIRPELSVCDIEDLQAKIETFREGGETIVRVRVTLPCDPSQIEVDPDNMLLDENPLNNRWKAETRFRISPVYTQLEEVDVVNPHDRWSVLAGPWFAGATYADPWYTRSTLAGFRLGAFRTQQFAGGIYYAYRSNDRNVVLGADAVLDHFPLPRTQIGFNFEKAVDNLSPGNYPRMSRGAIFARYVISYGSSLYLPPFEHVEIFADAQENPLPQPKEFIPGTDAFNQRSGYGIHWHKYLLTPYWDPEGGAALDVTYKYGPPIVGHQDNFQQVFGQFSTVKSMPVPDAWQGRIGAYLRETRWAFRFGGGAALPDDGLFYSLGGGEYFRGYDTRARLGSSFWIGSVEWRMPIAKNLEWDYVDRILGVRHIYVAPFYDVGDTYIHSQSQGVAHAVGVGLRVDLAWFGLIERSMLRFDLAKSLDDSPVQFWFGVSHPF
jgi:hypothetical protein